MRLHTFALILSLSLTISQLARAETYVVNPDGSGDFPTIQDAIDAATDGDMIELTNGTFNGDGNWDLTIVGKAIEIRCQSGDPELCMLDGADGYRHHQAFVFQSGASTLVHGLKICNFTYSSGAGVASGSLSSPTISSCIFENIAATYAEGGAVRCTGGAVPTFTDCRFLSNHTVLQGGAIYVDGGGSLAITDCQFIGNWAEGGGGAVYLQNVTSATVSGCTFESNQTFNGSGGGIFVSGSSNTFDNCRFVENQSNGGLGGGGLYMESPEHAEVIGCDFEGNVVTSATFGGGGLMVWDGSSATVENCSFSANSAPTNNGGAVFCRAWDIELEITGCLYNGNSAYRGGALFLHAGTVSMNSCTLVENAAEDAGGALYSLYGTQNLTSCTSVANRAGSGRGVGGHWASSEGFLWAANTIFAFSTSGEALHCGELATATLSCCDVYGNDGGDWVGCIEDQYGVDGNIEEDPLFCNPAGGEFELEEFSPCAPFSPPNEECDLIGAWPVGCDPTSGIPDDPSESESSSVTSSWGSIKVAFR